MALSVYCVYVYVCVRARAREITWHMHGAVRVHSVVLSALAVALSCIYTRMTLQHDLVCVCVWVQCV